MMALSAGLHRLGALELATVRRDAERAGFVTFALPDGIADRASFFDAVRTTLPLDPTLQSSQSWDALADSLWEGLRAHAARRILIVWPDTSGMTRLASSDFTTAVDILSDVASSLSDPKVAGDPKDVIVVVA